MMARPWWLPGPVVLACMLLLFASCGRKTDPLVPASPRSEPVRDIRAVARDGVVFLSWAIPAKNVEGKDLNPAEVLGFRIFRSEPGREGKAARSRQIAVIDLAHPAPAEVLNGRVSWSDAHLNYGQTYGYRIRVMSARGGLSLPSDEVRLTPLLSLAAPGRLTAAEGDSRIMVTWDPVTTRSDGSAYDGFVGYNLYRGTAAGREGEAPLNKEPIRNASYLDTSVVNDRVYYYIVRAVDSPAQPWKESLDSPEASAAARDLTPPDRPTGLTVVPGVGRIFLTWNENRERDLAGYHVYRSHGSGAGYERLTNKPIDRTTFSDETVKPGIPYSYVVTAVDKAGNESAYSKGQQATAERLR